MKNTPKPFKVFLDTSVLLSGLNSPFGASGFIISLFKLNKISVVISEEVIAEAERVIKLKFPLLGTPFLDFLASRPLIVKRLTSFEIGSAYKILDSEDAPILAGAIKARADFLITLDKKFRESAGRKFRMIYPAEFLQKYREKEKM